MTNKTIKRFASIFALLLCFFSFFSFIFAAEAPVKIPETIEEITSVSQRFEASWRGIWTWLKENTYLRRIRDWINYWVEPEFQKRKDYFRQNFGWRKEELKEELKTEVPKTGKSLWERMKELIK